MYSTRCCPSHRISTSLITSLGIFNWLSPVPAMSNRLAIMAAMSLLVLRSAWRKPLLKLSMCRTRWYPPSYSFNLFKSAFIRVQLFSEIALPEKSGPRISCFSVGWVMVLSCCHTGSWEFLSEDDYSEVQSCHHDAAAAVNSESVGSDICVAMCAIDEGGGDEVLPHGLSTKHRFWSHQPPIYIPTPLSIYRHASSLI